MLRGLGMRVMEVGWCRLGRLHGFMGSGGRSGVDLSGMNKQSESCDTGQRAIDKR